MVEQVRATPRLEAHTREVAPRLRGGSRAPPLSCARLRPLLELRGSRLILEHLRRGAVHLLHAARETEQPLAAVVVAAQVDGHPVPG